MYSIKKSQNSSFLFYGRTFFLFFPHYSPIDESVIGDKTQHSIKSIFLKKAEGLALKKQEFISINTEVLVFVLARFNAADFNLLSLNVVTCGAK